MDSAKAKNGNNHTNGLDAHGKACSTNSRSIAKNKSRTESRMRHDRWWVLTVSRIERNFYEHVIKVHAAAARCNLKSRVVIGTAPGADRKIYELDRFVTEKRPLSCR